MGSSGVVINPLDGFKKEHALWCKSGKIRIPLSGGIAESDFNGAVNSRPGHVYKAFKATLPIGTTGPHVTYSVTFKALHDIKIAYAETTNNGEGAQVLFKGPFSLFPGEERTLGGPASRYYTDFKLPIVRNQEEKGYRVANYFSLMYCILYGKVNQFANSQLKEMPLCEVTYSFEYHGFHPHHEQPDIPIRMVSMADPFNPQPVMTPYGPGKELVLTPTVEANAKMEYDAMIIPVVVYATDGYRIVAYIAMQRQFMIDQSQYFNEYYAELFLGSETQRGSGSVEEFQLKLEHPVGQGITHCPRRFKWCQGTELYTLLDQQYHGALPLAGGMVRWPEGQIEIVTFAWSYFTQNYLPAGLYIAMAGRNIYSPYTLLTLPGAKKLSATREKAQIGNRTIPVQRVLGVSEWTIAELGKPTVDIIRDGDVAPTSVSYEVDYPGQTGVEGDLPTVTLLRSVS